MTQPAFPYRIPCDRELTEQERVLLRFLLSREAPERLAEVDRLRVVARCGCGRCPTVMFAPLEDVPRQPDNTPALADYWGRAPDGGLVGVVLRTVEGRLDELQAWSVDGKDVTDWPDPMALRPISEPVA